MNVADCLSQVLVTCGDEFFGPYCAMSTFRGVMHSSVPDECKPILLSGTQRIPFPSPLKKIKMPKKLKGSDAHLNEKLMQKEGPTMVIFFGTSWAPPALVMSQMQDDVLTCYCGIEH